jgi:prophage regulatory protein
MDTFTNPHSESLQRHDELLWSIKMVVQKTGLSRASIYRYTARKLFPPPRRIGPNRVAWLATEVVGWIETCPMAHELTACPPPASS